MKVLRMLPQSQGLERLVIFHHAGANANLFLPLARAWKGRFEIILLDLPGRNFRRQEAAILEIQELIDLLLFELESLPSKPTFFLGHSMGALIAYELSWQILKNNIFPIKRLGLSSLCPFSKGNTVQKISALPEEQFLLVVEEFSAIPELIKSDKDLLKQALRVIRNDILLMESYENKNQGILPIPTLLFGGDGDSKVPPEILLNWTSLVQVQGSPHLFPGGHFYIFNFFDECVRLLTKVSI